MENQTIKELTSFIKNSPTAFHAVKSIREVLTKEGFQELKESEKWKIEKGRKILCDPQPFQHSCI